MKTIDLLQLFVVSMQSVRPLVIALGFVTALMSSCTYIPTVEEARTAGYTHEELVKVRAAATRRYHKVKKKSDPQKELELRAVIAELTRRIDKNHKVLKPGREKAPEAADKRLSAPRAKPLVKQRDPELVRQVEQFIARGQSLRGPTDADIEKLRLDNKATETALEHHREYYKERASRP